MKLRTLVLALAGIASFAPAAHAALVMTNTPLSNVGADSYVTFNSLGLVNPPSFTENGASVNYTGTVTAIQGNFPVLGASGPDAPDWRPVNGVGYTLVTLPHLADAISLSLGNADTFDRTAILNGHIRIFGAGSVTLADFLVPDLAFAGLLGGTVGYTSVQVRQSNGGHDIAGYAFQVTSSSALGLNAAAADWSVADNLVSDTQSIFLGPDTPPAGGVPEPATWSLLIVGFGAIGAMMRRRYSSRHEPLQAALDGQG